MFRKPLLIVYNFRSQCFLRFVFELFSKSQKHIQVMFSLWIWSADVLFNYRFVITPILMSHTFSERSFRSLRLSCFEFFHKTSFRGSKQSIIGLGRLESWRYLEFIMESGFGSLDGPLWGSLVFEFAIFEVRISFSFIQHYFY